MQAPHTEHHLVHRAGWLRAAVLGANDGIVSTASLLAGVAAAASDSQQVLVAGLAGLVAGAMSMAAGEFVSVSSQADTERADLGREAQALVENREEEEEELALIYVERGLEPGLAKEVARQLMERDALASHARDELGISDVVTANPLQAAVTSALTFAAGAAIPLLAALLAPRTVVLPAVFMTALGALAALGVISARVGGAPTLPATLRVTMWGALAMGFTALIGWVVGVNV